MDLNEYEVARMRLPHERSRITIVDGKFIETVWSWWTGQFRLFPTGASYAANWWSYHDPATGLLTQARKVQVSRYYWLCFGYAKVEQR
jgi:hypothetical protein